MVYVHKMARVHDARSVCLKDNFITIKRGVRGLYKNKYISDWIKCCRNRLVKFSGVTGIVTPGEGWHLSGTA